MAKQPVKKEAETTGHQWDGIEEYNNPLPKWWVWIFYLTIIWGIAYTIAYPAWPGVKSATAGVLGWSTRGDVADDIKNVAERNAPKNTELESVELASFVKQTDSQLYGYARSAGEAVFNTWCAQCHHSGGAGAKGYPALNDDDWLWGGDIDAIHTTITHGIRSEADDDTRSGDMPAWGDMLEPEELDQVINYVLKISGNGEADMALAEQGATVFADNCASCHGDDGKGDRDLGAPNLTDAIWLYGGDKATITQTVMNGRKGLMPNWNQRLSEWQIRAVATYVHQLGGGE